METIVKFIENPQHGAKCSACGRTYRRMGMCCGGMTDKHWVRNRIVSKTLGKNGFVPDYVVNKPEPEQFWRVRIISELSPNQLRGCFLLEPLELIPEVPKLLIPGFFTHRKEGGETPTLIVTPDEPGCWMFSKEHRRSLTEQYNLAAIVVNLGGTPGWKVEGI